MSKPDSKKPMLVRDLMKVGVETCMADTPVVDVINLMLEHELEGIAVLDFDRHALGVITRDELVLVSTQGSIENLTAKEIMREGMPELPADIPVSAAAQLMMDQNLRIVYMMHHASGFGYPAAMLTYKHLIRHMVGEDDLSDLGIKAERESPIETFIRRRDEARQKNIDLDS